MTAAAFEGGWFHSGDRVRQDEDGYTNVFDRLKDMIISGGDNVYCAEAESVLAEHSKAAEMSIVGVPDEKWVLPLAVVVPTDLGDPSTAAEVVRWCWER